MPVSYNLIYRSTLWVICFLRIPATGYRMWKVFTHEQNRKQSQKILLISLTISNLLLCHVNLGDVMAFVFPIKLLTTLLTNLEKSSIFLAAYLKVLTAYDKVKHVKLLRVPPFRLKTTLLTVSSVVSGFMMMLIVNLLIEQLFPKRQTSILILKKPGKQSKLVRQWIEYITENGGLGNLEPASIDMNFVQYFPLDVLGLCPNCRLTISIITEQETAPETVNKVVFKRNGGTRSDFTCLTLSYAIKTFR
uniref:Uncharacterized protein n=1 Tax=Romanomermis culicivorax TaxID=13658 RepID=A0A915KFW6_ROMCU